ncbi:PDZ domain-containing protein/Peptidase_S41 domain-containing protein [Cephalotus follicularis]|uniref:C-terminal processing peptidase n=1 Tax=Cephalotus follicularis TaxID=3775 RepID=A0A1Q3B355_CEPFO|nr:PDZ domain-containing protein/Peptidase_S41 domain-containing protein [Cephalotus follicularis]
MLLMEVLASSATRWPSLYPQSALSNINSKPNCSFNNSTISQVLPFKSMSVRIVDARLWSPLLCARTNANTSHRGCSNSDGSHRRNTLIHPIWRLNRSFSSKFSLFPMSYGCLFKLKCRCSLRKVTSCLDKFRQRVFVPFVAIMLVTSVCVAVNNAPSWALTEENLLFLEAWRTIDRAYIDKTFNGHSWFRYRENVLRNEPMNTREETYNAIRKMLATLDDPFTRFLEPEKFKSLRSGTQGALTGVGLSIGYPTAVDGSTSGLVVISASPGGPASRAGILSGDIIMEINNTSTENMGIYDAAERLQGSEGSPVELTVQSGSEIKHFALTRERVSLNPVKARLCEVPGMGKESYRIGYIKLSSFNQNASDAVKETINTLKSNGVNAFVLDLRDNSGGLFPEGIEIAKIWLKKGVIVYVCDNRGVRDIYDTDGSSAIAASEPLAVLVNKGTASASEILAGALKDNNRAVLFGEPTFGKGKIQSVFQLSDGSGLAVTVARYETPAHTDINKVGVIPDHPLPQSFPKDEEAFCGCLQDPASACYVNRVQLLSR